MIIIVVITFTMEKTNNYDDYTIYELINENIKIKNIITKRKLLGVGNVNIKKYIQDSAIYIIENKNYFELNITNNIFNLHT